MMGITLNDIAAQRAMLARGEEKRKADWKQAERERLRDTFAAAALTGFIRGMPDATIFHLGLISQQSYEVADAMLRERGNHSEKPNSSPNLDAAPAARADSRPLGNPVASAVTGTGETLSKAEIDAIQRVVEDGRLVDLADYGCMRSLLVRLRPEWGDEESDRSKPINDDRLAALEKLSALDQELELKHGIKGNPMIKARRNNDANNLVGEPAVSKVMHMMADEIERLRTVIRPESYAISDEKRVLCDTNRDTTQPRNGAL